MAESRTRTTLSDQLAVQDSSHLRDLLKVREEDTDGAAIGVRRESHSLGAALASEKNGSSRSLFDMIRTEEGPSDSSSSAGTGGWRGGFKDQLRVQAADTAWTETPPPGVAVTPTPYRAPSLARTLSVRPPETPAAAAAPESPPPPQSPAAPVEPVRISLMALLAQTDSYGGEDGEESPAGGEEEEDDGEEDDGGGGGELQCCVCMVRHKGAAFIPCGHTFCRLCSRELWVSRGNCPLCNGYILEILDIF